MRKRLRKKLHVGEFNVPLLPIVFEMIPFESVSLRNAFLDRFNLEAIEENGLQFGGGGMGEVWRGFAEPAGRSRKISPDQVAKVESWLSVQREIRRFAVGPVMRDSEVLKKMDEDPDFPALKGHA